MNASDTMNAWSKMPPLVVLSKHKISLNSVGVRSKLQVIASSSKSKRASVDADLAGILARAWWTFSYWVNARRGALPDFMDPFYKMNRGVSSWGWEPSGKPASRVDVVRQPAEI